MAFNQRLNAAKNVLLMFILGNQSCDAIIWIGPGKMSRRVQDVVGFERRHDAPQTCRIHSNHQFFLQTFKLTEETLANL